jgi:hypothetical protein
MDILTLKSERFGEFIEKFEPLVRAECRHNFDGARKVMREMGNINIPRTLQYFEENGGYCDCEIIYNVVIGGGRHKPVEFGWVMN